jgi:hypothetical protein
MENSLGKVGGTMEVAEILSRFERFTSKFEREAVVAAVARREEVTPELLRVLEEIADPDRAFQLDAEEDYMAHLYAMYLLAQFRETRAFPIVLQIAQLDGDLLDSLFGDFITESLGNVLASVCGGKVEEIQSLIENADADEWVRGAALGSLTTLVGAGIRSREEILDYFASLFRGKLTDKNENVWSELVLYSTDLYGTELVGDIERAYAEGLIDEMMLTLDDVHRDLAKGKEWAMEQLASNPHRHLVDDTVKEMEWWACFKEKKPRVAREEDHYLGAADPIHESWFPPYKRTGPKIGRNDPCTCGSGKKYKKCCGG